MIAELILWIVGIGLICYAIKMASDHQPAETKSKKDDKEEGIIFFLTVLGLLLLSIGSQVAGTGTAQSTGIIGMGISDGVYTLQSDFVSIQGNERLLSILMVPLTNIQDSGLSDEWPTYYKIKKDNVILPLAKGDIVEVRNSIIAKSKFLKDK
ncbi:hypothetical protein KJ575_03905 [Patescibacteria group bacterium]|nr:hypothetical protein [Patescibacteria group bacterium]